ncbi:hypothetical protein ACWDTP_18320 [Mycobacterium sp. NPDC003449]
MHTAGKRFGVATVAASGLAAAVIGLAAPAQAAPSGSGNAQQTIRELQARGYKVIVNRVGSAPLEQASVLAVRPGTHYGRPDTMVAGITQRTVYVDVQ